MFAEEDLLASTNSVVSNLDLEDNYTLEELVRKVSLLREKPIILRSSSLPATVSGFSIKSTKGCYVIWYDNARPLRNATCVILHELTHILKGDLEAVEANDEYTAYQSVRKNMQISGTVGIACRKFLVPLDWNEAQVEMIALSLLQKLKLDFKGGVETCAEHWFENPG